jgi:hypothetical protein
MRIGLYALDLSPGQMGGVETYVHNLVANLGVSDSDNEYLVFLDRHNRTAFGPDLLPNVRWLVITLPQSASPVVRALRYWGWLPSPLADQLERSGVDLIHYPDSIINRLGLALLCLLTSHDIQHEYFPHYLPLKTRVLRSCHTACQLERQGGSSRTRSSPGRR